MKYEYLVYTCDDASMAKSVRQSDMLNEYGKQGWELVSVTTNCMPFNVYRCFYFKRPLLPKA